jgi:ferrous iron transport protein A
MRRQPKGEKNMPIVVAPIGKDLRIVKILADEKTKKHLNNLGLTVDSTVQVLSNSGGTVICLVKDGRLALDRTLSTKILVA